MNTKKLLSKGYFPKELPPPFDTTQFAQKAQYIKTKWENLLAKEQKKKNSESVKNAKSRFKRYIEPYKKSKCTHYTIPKGTYSRRKLRIPNPKQYHELCLFIARNWNLVQNRSNSSFSESKPTEKDAERSLRTISKTFNNFRFLLIEKSFDKKYELKLDIAQFYPSIYTHSLAWAFLGKDNAKYYHSLAIKGGAAWENALKTDVQAKIYKIGDKLDSLVRSCQDMQSVGLPIGPDSSFLLSEIVASRIDSEVIKLVDDIDFTCVRYIDDYYFYVNNYNDAERILKTSQEVFNKYQLETNENKVSIKKIPFPLIDEWYLELSTFDFKKLNAYKLRDYFSLLFKLMSQYPKESNQIASYGLTIFEYGNVIIKKDNWNLFLDLLLKVVNSDGSIINKFFKIILSYEVYISKSSKTKIGKTLSRVIKEHLQLTHSFEVSWALWILKSLGIKCDKELIIDVINSEDYISRIICLDIINENLVSGKLSIKTKLLESVSSDDLTTEKWLYTYEAISQGWINPTKKIIESNKYFSLLYNYKVNFYNKNNQIGTNFKVISEIDEPPFDTDELYDNLVKRSENVISHKDDY